MDSQTDTTAGEHAKVVAELHKRPGEVRAIAAATGLSYDTVLRIKNGEGDPGYSKVKKLLDHLFPSEPVPDIAAPSEAARAGGVAEGQVV